MARGGNRDWGRAAIIGLPVFWLGLFFLVPFLIIFRMSLSDPASAQPPYKPLIDWSQGWEGFKAFYEALDFENYVTVLTDGLYIPDRARHPAILDELPDPRLRLDRHP
jgi:putrescine transport system permease protein